MTTTWQVAAHRRYENVLEILRFTEFVEGFFRFSLISDTWIIILLRCTEERKDQNMFQQNILKLQLLVVLLSFLDSRTMVSALNCLASFSILYTKKNTQENFSFVGTDIIPYSHCMTFKLNVMVC